LGLKGAITMSTLVVTFDKNGAGAEFELDKVLRVRVPTVNWDIVPLMFCCINGDTMTFEEYKGKVALSTSQDGAVILLYERSGHSISWKGEPSRHYDVITLIPSLTRLMTAIMVMCPE